MITLSSGKTHAYNVIKVQDNKSDSVEISLLTCSPGNEIYSLYGHTAIRYTNYKKNIDIVINYGVFSFDTPFFIPKFIFGLTDYEMGIIPFIHFYNEYNSNGRSVIQQNLNLTYKEKVSVINAIEKNYFPQNRIYRYNYFYDNCTTRARDILLNNINGEIEYNNKQESFPSFREMIHSFNNDYPWARFGNDILLGVTADRKTTRNEYQFLPSNLKKDFDNIIIRNENGTTRPLVTDCFYIINNNLNTPKHDIVFRPTTVAWLFLCLVIITTLFEFFLKKDFYYFDILLLFFDGCIGIILFMMLFSKHPTTSTNLQILLFNPLSLFFIHRVIKKIRNKEFDKFWLYATGIIILYFFAGFFQEYAEGTNILALSLLLRCIRRTIPQKK